MSPFQQLLKDNKQLEVENREKRILIKDKKAEVINQQKEIERLQTLKAAKSSAKQSSEKNKNKTKIKNKTKLPRVNTNKSISKFPLLAINEDDYL